MADIILAERIDDPNGAALEERAAKVPELTNLSHRIDELIDKKRN